MSDRTAVDLGMFHGEALELVGGHLLIAEPQGSYHVTGVGLLHDALRAALPAGWLVRMQMPVALDDESEPDVALVPGAWEDYRERHPSHPALVVEIADSSLVFDRDDKGSLYARGGVSDYWVVNLVDRVLEVYREPMPDPAARYGWRYRTVERLGPGSIVSPLAAPEVRLVVSALLP